MAYKKLELTVLSTRDLKKANPTEKMDVYVVVSLSGDPRYRYKKTTPVHRDNVGPGHYYWGSTAAFHVDETKLEGMTATFRLKRKRSFLWDKKVGRVRVRVNDLLHKKGQTSDHSSTFRFRVQAPSGEYQGEFEFSVKISDSDWIPPPPPAPQPQRAAYGYPYAGIVPTHHHRHHHGHHHHHNFGSHGHGFHMHHHHF